MSSKPRRAVHSQKVAHSPQSTGKSSRQKDLSHKESEGRRQSDKDRAEMGKHHVAATTPDERR